MVDSWGPDSPWPEPTPGLWRTNDAGGPAHRAPRRPVRWTRRAKLLAAWLVVLLCVTLLAAAAFYGAHRRCQWLREHQPGSQDTLTYCGRG